MTNVLTLEDGAGVLAHEEYLVFESDQEARAITSYNDTRTREFLEMLKDFLIEEAEKEADELWKTTS